MTDAARRRDRAPLLVMAFLLMGGLMIGPARAHLGSFAHLERHFATKKEARQLAPRSAGMAGGADFLTSTPTPLGEDVRLRAPRSGWVIVSASVTFGNPSSSPALDRCTATNCNVQSLIRHVGSGRSSSHSWATVSSAGTVTTYVTTGNHHRFRVRKGVHTFRLLVSRFGATGGDLTAGAGQLTAIFSPR